LTKDNQCVTFTAFRIVASFRLECPHVFFVTPLEATLTSEPTSVASKGLTKYLNPAFSTLTKNRVGWGYKKTVSLEFQRGSDSIRHKLGALLHL
jgi:hypothetical protein